MFSVPADWFPISILSVTFSVEFGSLIVSVLFLMMSLFAERLAALVTFRFRLF